MYNRKEHYKIEKNLAKILKKAPRKKRLTAYTETYDELFRKIPDHPQLTGAEQNIVDKEYESKKNFISRFFSKDINFIEFGAGDGSFCNFISDKFNHLYSVDCSEYLNSKSESKANVEKIVRDCASPLQLSRPIGVAFSSHFLEHLHPKDSILHLKNVYNLLEARGVYLILVPNKCGGPHDISREYDDFATCFHLNECTSFELIASLKEAGFSRVKLYVCASYKTIRVPISLVTMLENMILKISPKLRRWVMGTFLFRPLNQLRLIAYK
jgi:SAM-dependent methyltransferase